MAAGYREEGIADDSEQGHPDVVFAALASLADVHRRYFPGVHENINSSPPGRRSKLESQPLSAYATLHRKRCAEDGLALRWALPYGVLVFKI